MQQVAPCHPTRRAVRRLRFRLACHSRPAHGLARMKSWSTSSDALSRRILSGGGKTSATSAASFAGSGKSRCAGGRDGVGGSLRTRWAAGDCRDGCVRTEANPVEKPLDLLTTRYSSGRVMPAALRGCAGSLSGHPPMRSGRPPVPERPDTTRQSCFRPRRHRRRGSVRRDRRS